VLLCAASLLGGAAQYDAGTTSILRMVDEARSKVMTLAIGARISLPGSPAPSATRTSTNPVDRAVTSMIALRPPMPSRAISR
jgi:hypothetical protein